MSAKQLSGRAPAGAFIVRFDEPLPPICMLTSRYSHSTPVHEDLVSLPHLKTPKAQQFPKTVIPALKHEAKSYFSLISSQREEQKRNYLRYPKAKRPIAEADKDLDAFFVSNGRVKRKENPLRPNSKDSDDTEIGPYRAKVKARPDLTGLKEMGRESAEMRRTLDTLLRELGEFTSNSYLMPGGCGGQREGLRSVTLSPQSFISSWTLKSSTRKSDQL